MMRGLFRSLLVLAVLIEVYWLLPPRYPKDRVKPVGQRVGALHVRSPDPLTAQNLEIMTSKARKAGIDFIVIADDKSSHARSVGLEGEYDGVDVYVELEAHTRAGHAVVFYSHTTAKELSDEALGRAAWGHFLGTDPRPGLFLVVAHPDSRANPWNRLDRFSEGMELVNLDTLWRNSLESSPLSLFVTALLFPASGYLSALRLVEIPEKNLQGWDAINAVSPGHFGVTAQEISPQSWLPTWMGSHWSLATALLPAALNTVFLPQAPSADFATRKQQTYEALGNGNSSMFFPFRLAYHALDWRLDCGEKSYRAGNFVPSALQGCKFKIEMEPELAALVPNLRLLRDGKIVTQWTNQSTNPPETPLAAEATGSYRLEVSLSTRTPFGILVNKEIPYAFYNPIYVR